MNERIQKLVDIISENYYQDKNAVFIASLGLLSDENVLFYGPKATGKTTLARQIVSATDSIPTELEKNATFQGSVTSPTTVFGAPNVKKIRENGEIEYKLRKTPFVKYGRILDEINRADSETQNVLLPMLDERRKIIVNGMPIGDANDAYIGTANLDGIGTHSVSEQLEDRFGILVYLKDLPTSNIKIINGKRAELEDIIGGDKEIIEKFKRDGVTEDLRGEYSEIFGTLSPEDVREIKEKAKQIEIPEEYFLPLSASIARLKYFNNEHYRSNIEYLKYLDSFSAGRRIELTLKKILPTYFAITGKDVNENNVESAIFDMLPYILPKYIHVSSEGESYLRNKYNSGEILSSDYNTREGRLSYISELLSKKLKDEYDKIKVPLKSALTDVASGRDASYDHPLIREFLMIINERSGLYV